MKTSVTLHHWELSLKKALSGTLTEQEEEELRKLEEYQVDWERDQEEQQQEEDHDQA